MAVYQRFYSDSQTLVQFSEEGSEAGLDRKTGESISEIKETIYKGTGVSSTGLRLKK